MNLPPRIPIAEIAAMRAPAPSALWPAPEPLLDKVEPLPYPVDALPATVRAAVDEVQGFVQAPVPLVAGCALSALSIAVQAHHDVARAERLSGPSSLFLLTIAESGERKSTADGFFMQAIRAYERGEREKAEPLIRRYQTDMKAWEAKRAGVIDAIRQEAKKPTGKVRQLEQELRDLEAGQPIEPRYPRLTYGDVTPEELARKLAKVWPSGAVVSAEAGIVFGSHGMGKESAMRNMALLNTLWDGNALTIDRKTTESFTVEGARLTTALQVQESALREFFESTGKLARGTGFLARFLVAWPESTRGSRLFKDAPEMPRLAAFNRRVTQLLGVPAPMDEGGRLQPSMLTFTPEAKRAWMDFHDAVERRLGEGGELHDVSDVASKIADNAARLAALFHTFEGEPGAIGAETVQRAAKVAAWHLSESRRFFGELAIAPELADACRLDEWLTRYCRREQTHIVPRREVQRRGPGGLRDRKRLDAAIGELVSMHRVREVAEGKRRDLYVSPKVIGGEA